MITGQIFSLITAVGLLVLVGVIVNNGIVLISYISMLRKRGESLEDACVDSARSRLRPILMTTLTTLLALIPMAFAKSEGSSMQIANLKNTFVLHKRSLGFTTRFFPHKHT